MKNFDIPQGKLCNSGCGLPAQYFSKGTGRYRCAKSANSCPANKIKNSEGLKKAHSEGRVHSFNDEHRQRSHVSHRCKLVEKKPFEELGLTLRKKIVMEEQEYKCLYCGFSEWMGLRIKLELDHIDGNRHNNVRSNVRCLCPNCHSITDTWKVGKIKGKKIRKCSDEEIINAFKKCGTINATLKELGYNWGSAGTVRKVLFQYKLIDLV